MQRLIPLELRGFALPDLIAVLMVGILLLGLLIGCRRDSLGSANQIKCSRYLRSIGQSMLQYANENKGNYPRTNYAEGTIVKPVWGTGTSAGDPFKADGPGPNDVSAAIFLLIRTQDITTECFVCPSSDAEKDQGGSINALNQSNFTDVAKNLSYSLANPYPDSLAAEKGYVWKITMNAAFALAADMNPGMSAGADNVTTVKVDSPMSKLRNANSLNHGGDGQNVLFADGHVEFASTPFVGIEKDNIYTAKSGGIEESPVDASDSVLLPAKE